MKQILIDAGFTLHEAIIIEWQFGYAGGFQAKLMELIAQADTPHRSRISYGFSDEVNAFNIYSHEPGWWQDVEERFLKFRETEGE